MQMIPGLESLENQVRTLKRMVYGWGLLFVVFSPLMVTGLMSLLTVPDFIQVKKLEIVNGAGRPVVLLGSNDAGGFFEIKNGEGHKHVELISHMEGGTVSIQNGLGETLVLIGGNEHGSGALQTRNNQG